MTRAPSGQPGSVADRLDDARALVAEHRGAACRGRPVDRVVVRMAHAARVQADPHLPRSRVGEFQLLDVQRAADGLEDGGTDAHHPAASPSNVAGGRPLPAGEPSSVTPCFAASSSSGMWQRMKWPGSYSLSGGCS